ncbi:MAG: TolC family protein, partial [Myxococcota bacterium]
AVAQEALTAGNLESALALQERTDVWFEVGQVDQAEVARVKSERIQAERDQLKAQQEVRRAADTLLLQLGEAPGQDITPEGDGTFALPAALSVEEHQRLAEDGNVGLALAALDIEDARADLKDANAERLPSLTVSGSVGRASLEDNAADAFAALGDDRGFTSYGVAAELSTPIGGRAARASRNQAQAALSAAEIQHDNTLHRLRSDVQLAVQNVEVAFMDVELAQAKLDAARKTEDSEVARLDAGVRRLDELLDARRRRVSAEDDVQQANQALALAHLELAQLEGRVDNLLDGSVR